MAFRLIFLLAAAVLMARNCECDESDNFLEYLYNRLVFPHSGRAAGPAGKRDVTHKPTIDLNVPLLVDTPQTTEHDNSGGKRAFDAFDTHKPGQQQKNFGRFAERTKNGMWPCYCK